MTVVPRVAWTENEEEVEITVEAASGRLQGKDVSATYAMLKVNAQGCVLALDLFDDVDTAKTRIEVKGGTAVAHFRKVGLVV